MESSSSSPRTPRLILHEMGFEVSDHDTAFQDTLVQLDDLKLLVKLLAKTSSDVTLYDTTSHRIWEDELGVTQKVTGPRSAMFNGYADGYEWRLHARCVEGGFPEYQRLMPNIEDLESASVNRAALLESLKAASTHLASGNSPADRYIMLDLQSLEGLCRVHGSSDAGSFDETVEVSLCNAATLCIGVNVDYLIAGVEAHPDEEWITISANPDETFEDSGRASKPMYIGADYLQMPMNRGKVR